MAQAAMNTTHDDEREREVFYVAFRKVLTEALELERKFRVDFWGYQFSKVWLSDSQKLPEDAGKAPADGDFPIAPFQFGSEHSTELWAVCRAYMRSVWLTLWPYSRIGVIVNIVLGLITVFQAVLVGHATKAYTEYNGTLLMAYSGGLMAVYFLTQRLQWYMTNNTPASACPMHSKYRLLPVMKRLQAARHPDWSIGRCLAVLHVSTENAESFIVDAFYSTIFHTSQAVGNFTLIVVVALNNVQWWAAICGLLFLLIPSFLSIFWLSKTKQDVEHLCHLQDFWQNKSVEGSYHHLEQARRTRIVDDSLGFSGNDGQRFYRRRLFQGLLAQMMKSNQVSQITYVIWMVGGVGSLCVLLEDGRKTSPELAVIFFMGINACRDAMESISTNYVNMGSGYFSVMEMRAAFEADANLPKDAATAQTDPATATATEADTLLKVSAM